MSKRRNPEATHKTYIFSHPGLWVVLLIFFIVTGLHSIVVPITQGGDELAHYRYISFIAQTGHLPKDDAEREQAWYRSDWPALYHLLVGWAISPLDTSQPYLKDVGDSPRRRLVGEIFYPRLIIYTEDANWPWQDGILVWHLGRFISIIFSGLALGFTYFTALELSSSLINRQSKTIPSSEFRIPNPLKRSGSPKPKSEIQNPKSPKLFATTVTAILAFTPRFLFTSAMLGDDSLFVLLSAIFIWLLLRALQGNDHGWVYATLGLLMGLSISTKYSTGLFPLVIILVVWWRTKQTQWGWLQGAGRLGLAWLFTLIGASWWFGWLGYHFNTIQEDGPVLGLLRSVLATGPDVSMGRIFALLKGEEFSGPIRPSAIGQGTFTEWLTYLFQTFWGVPVLEVAPFFPWLYLVMFLLCGLAAVGLWYYWKAAPTQPRMAVAVLGTIIFLLLPFPILRFFLTFNVLETGQGRHILYPAAQSIAILLALGWFTVVDRLAPKLKPTYAARANYYPLLVPVFLLGWSVAQLIYMSYTYPKPLPVQSTTFKAATISNPLKHTFTDDIQLLGYDFDPDPEQAIINLTLYWEALGQVEENYRTRVQLIGEDGQPHLIWVSHPLDGLYPTRAWDKGDIIHDTLPLPLAAIPADNYNLQLDLLYEAENSLITDEPFEFIFIPLAKKQPIANASILPNGLEYRLWIDNQPLRHRQSIPLSWNTSAAESQPIDWALVGPDDLPRNPITRSDATAIFTVGGNWPSGDYRLAIAGEVVEPEPVLTVANEVRQFEVSTDPAMILVAANFVDQVELIGYTLDSRWAEPGEGLPLTLYWRSLAPVLGDYMIFDVLLDKHQAAYGGYDRLPREYYSTILWTDGEVVEDGFAVPVRSDAPPGIYNLHVGLYSLETGEPVSLPIMHNGQPSETTSVVIGPVKIGGPPIETITTNPAPQYLTNQSFSDQITLLGYDLTDDKGHSFSPTLNPQSPNLHLTLYWQANTFPAADYTTFVHIRDANNQPVAQKDQPPAAGQYPTSLWGLDEVIVDEITIPLNGLSAGKYTPVIGLYDASTGIRLLTPNIPENELRLESVTLP